MKKIKILLADDHALMRFGLRTLLSVEKDMTVVGEADSGDAAVSATRDLHPDVIISDLMMPGKPCAEAIRQILASAPDVRILILTSFGTSQDLVDAMSAGATGVLLKDTAMECVAEAVRAVCRGQQVIPDTVARLLEEAAEMPPLTERQLEILHSVVRGLSDRDIAEQYGMTHSGAKHHMRSIFAKLGAANRTEAVAIALKHQLLKI